MSADHLQADDRPTPASRGRANDVHWRSVAALTFTVFVGGYALVYFAADAIALCLATSGATSRADAVLIGTNLAFLLAPAVVIWAFSIKGLWKAAAPPFVAALGLALLAGLLQP